MGCHLRSDGRAERLIGETLEKLIAEKQVRRDELTIISKFGFLEGVNLQRARMLDTFPRSVPYSETGLYSLDPVFMRSEISASLERLRSDYIDAYLLQTPEVSCLAYDVILDLDLLMTSSVRFTQLKIFFGGIFLQIYLESSLLLHNVTDTKDDRVQQVLLDFRERLVEAFTELERQCQSGRIRSYGVSSSLYTSNVVENPVGIFFPDLLKIADEAAHAANSKKHHFKVILAYENGPGWISRPSNHQRFPADKAFFGSAFSDCSVSDRGGSHQSL